MSEPVYFVVERRAGCETPSIIVEHLPADVKRNAVYKLRLDRLPDAERWLAMTTAELYRTYCYMRDRGTLPTLADPRPKKGEPARRQVGGYDDQKPPEALDKIARVVLAYHPKPKTKAAKARKRRATKAQKPK